MKTQFIGVTMVALVCFAPGMALDASAALLVYEGFDYGDGVSLTNASGAAYVDPINSGGGSFGWAGRWGNLQPGGVTNVGTSLIYTDLAGKQLQTSGGSAVASGVPTTGNAQPSRNLAIGVSNGPTALTYSGLLGVGSAEAAAVGEGTTNYWISFLAKRIEPLNLSGVYPTSNPRPAPPYFTRKGSVALKTGSAINSPYNSGVDAFDFGSPNTNSYYGPFSGDTNYDTWSTWNGGDGGYTINSNVVKTSYSITNTTFVLMLAVVNTNATTAAAGLDTVYTWLNWTNLAIEPTLATATATNQVQLTGFNNFRLDANGNNASGTNGVIQVDEFRLGDTFADVAPIAVATVTFPTLHASLGAGNINLSWSATEGSNYVLEATTSLSSPTVWSAVGGALNTNLDVISTALPATNGESYFRLKK